MLQEEVLALQNEPCLFKPKFLNCVEQFNHILMFDVKEEKGLKAALSLALLKAYLQLKKLDSWSFCFGTRLVLVQDSRNHWS